MLNITRGALVEYTPAMPPLAFVFDFNPQTISRTRAVTLRADNTPGHRGYDFKAPTEAPRAAQGVTVQPETFSVEILVDATDALMRDDPVALQFGIEPQLDTLRSMVEPKAQGPDGVRLLASLGAGRERAVLSDESASVLLFVWGTHVLPVFLTSVKVDERAHLPTLVPYRANVSLTMQVLEGRNPFYVAEKLRQSAGAGVGSVGSIGSAIGGLL